MRGIKGKVIFSLTIIACVILTVCIWITLSQKQVTINRTITAVAQQTQKENDVAETGEVDITTVKSLDITENFEEMMDQKGVTQAISENNLTTITTSKYTELATNKDDYTDAKGVKIKFGTITNTNCQYSMYISWPSKKHYGKYEYYYQTYSTNMSNSTIYVPSIEFNLSYSRWANYSGNDTLNFNISSIEPYYEERNYNANVSNSGYVPSNVYCGDNYPAINATGLTSTQYYNYYYTLYEPEAAGDGNVQVAVLANSYEAPEGRFEDGSTVKFYSVPSGTTIYPTDFESPINTDRNEFRGYSYKTSNTNTNISVFTSKNVTNNFVLSAYYDQAVEMDYWELVYDSETGEVTKKKLQSRIEYSNNIKIPAMPEKDGYMFYGWTNNYRVDEGGLNLMIYSHYEDGDFVGIDMPNDVYCTYYLKGGGPFSNVYISNEYDETEGYDGNTGTSPYNAVYSLDRALQLLKKDGTIWVAGTVYLNTGARSGEEPLLTLEGFGKNAKFKRAETCKREMFIVESFSYREESYFYEYIMAEEPYFEFRNVAIDGSGEFIRSDSSMIVACDNVVLNEGTIIENNFMSWVGNREVLEDNTNMETSPAALDGISQKEIIGNYNSSYTDTDVSGGAGIRLMHGADMIMNDGAVIRNNKVIYKTGDEKFENEWLEDTEIVKVEISELFDSSDYYEKYADSDVTFKLAFEDIKDVAIVFDNHSYVDGEVIIYDENYNPCYYFYPDTYFDKSMIIYGDEVYIRFTEGLSEDERLMMYEVANYSKYYPEGYITMRKGALGGGAIALDNEGAEMLMNGGEIYGNSSYWGGAIYVGPQNHLTVNDGKIYNNEAEYGGAIYAEWHTPTIAECTANYREKGNKGVGLENLYGSDIVGEFVEELEEELGVAVESGDWPEILQTLKNYDKPDVIINDADIYNNSAREDGGAIYVDAALVETNGGNIYNNTAKNSGGGIYVSDGVSIVEDFELYLPNYILTGGEVSDNLPLIGNAVYSRYYNYYYDYPNGETIYTTITIEGNEIPSTFEMNGGNIYGNTAYVGGGIYNANKCLLKEGNIYENNTTKSLSETGNYAGDAVYAFEDVVIWPSIKLEGDVRVCVDEGANIVTPEGLSTYKSYNSDDNNIIEVSVEENIAHEDYVIVKGNFSKTGYDLLTQEQIKCAEAAKKAKTGTFKDVYIEESEVKNGNYQLDLDNYLIYEKVFDYVEDDEITSVIFDNIYRNNINVFKEVDGIYETNDLGNAYLITEKFTLADDGSVTFEWANSGDSNSYMYVDVFNEDGMQVKSLGKIYANSTVTDVADLVYTEAEIADIPAGTYYLQIYYNRYSTGTGLGKAYVKEIEYTQNDIRYPLYQSQYEIYEREKAGFKEVEEGVLEYEHNGYYADANFYSIYGIVSGKLGKISFEYANTSDEAKLYVSPEFTYGSYALGSTVVNGEVTWQKFEYTQKDFYDFIELSYDSVKDGDKITIRNIKFEPFDYSYKNQTEVLEESEKQPTFEDVSLISNVNYFENNNGTYSSTLDKKNTKMYIDASITEVSNLTFDWDISSYATNYIRVMTINKDTAQSTELLRVVNSDTVATTEDELNYKAATAELPIGEYFIVFEFYRGNTTDTGLNKAYVKNIKINDTNIDVITKEEVNSMYGFELVDGIYKSKANAISQNSVLYDEYLYIEEDSSLVFEYLYTGNNAMAGELTFNVSNNKLENIIILMPDTEWRTISIPLDEGEYGFEILYSLNDSNMTQNNLQLRNVKLMKRTYEYNAENLNYILNDTDLNHVKYIGVNNWGTKLDTNTNQIELTKEIEVTKIWDDNENKANLRPESITVELFKNGESQGNIEITATNDWKYIITEAGRANWDKEEPTYVISETQVENYILETTSVEEGKVTLTNKIDNFDIKTSTDGEGGTISGKDEDPYEEVEFGETTVKIIEIVPEPGYQVDTIKINDIEIEFTETEEHIVILDQIENVTEDKNIVVTFKKIEAQVTVHHYVAIENEDGTYTYTENRVLKSDGTEVADETISGYVGETYTANQSAEIAEEYVFLSRSDNTEEKVFVEGGKAVNFYYKLANTNIRPSIDKEGTSEINSKEQVVEYTISYNAEVNNYVGSAELIVVDTLPYEIDEALSDIDGGVYDETTKTITWTETINSINTVLSGTYTHNFNKAIKVVYKDIDVKVLEIKNTVEGTMKLLTTAEEEIISDEFITDGNYKVDIPVQIIWNDTENQEKRPDIVIVEIYEGDTVIDRKEISTTENTITFEDLDKYDDNGDEIKYTIKEKEKNEQDLYLYTIEEDNENYTITNTYEKLNERIDVTVNKVWEDNNNSQNKRPNSIIVVLYGDGNEVARQEISEWTYTFESLPKYNNTVSPATEIVYTVAEFEKTSGDLQYYIGSAEGYTLTNTYKNLAPQADSKVEKVSGDVLTSKDGIITYEITYSGIINDYYGTATVTLVDNLPYRIDTNKSSVDGATYNETERTLTWTEEITNIDTYTNGEYRFEITKEIKLSYVNIDVTQKSVINNAYGKISYNESDVADVKTDIATCENEVDLKFDLEIEKEIIGVFLNDNERTVSDPKLAKISMRKSQVNNSDLYVEYMITVRNTGDLIGKATVVEEMTEGLSFVSEQSDDRWYEGKNGELKVDLTEINPGDTIELVVVGKWNKKAYGTLTNEVRLENVENEAGFNEVSEDNNTDSCEMIVDTFTGMLQGRMVLGIEFIIVVSLIVILVKPSKKENKL